MAHPGCRLRHRAALAKLEAAFTAPIIGLGLDIAKDAARRWPTLAFAVADLWSKWPVHDDAVDLVISVFAPKNFSEMARVLRPGGWVAVAYPGPDHLVELGDHFGLIGQHGDKTRGYSELASRFLGPPAIHRLLGGTVLDGGAIRAGDPDGSECSAYRPINA